MLGRLTKPLTIVGGAVLGFVAGDKAEDITSKYGLIIGAGITIFVAYKLGLFKGGK